MDPTTTINFQVLDLKAMSLPSNPKWLRIVQERNGKHFVFKGCGSVYATFDDPELAGRKLAQWHEWGDVRPPVKEMAL